MKRDEARQKWLAQLRSPDAKKQIGMLENISIPNKRCCLGHACHALGSPRAIDKNKVLYGKKKTYGTLPRELAVLLGITIAGHFEKTIFLDIKPTIQDVKRPVSFDSLTEINDETDLTPSQISDVIEEQFKADNFMDYEDSKVIYQKAFGETS